jgi:hypothetical protein
MAEPILTAARLRQLYSYDPEAGSFTRLVRIGRNHFPGVVAGAPFGKGYRRLRVDGQTYVVHRLVWLYVNGNWPNGDIDHIDGDKSNNRICNLRDVNRSTNLENLKGTKAKDKSRLLGAFPVNKRSWFSRIQVKGRSIYLGCFQSAEDAHAAYLAAKREFHEGNTL